MALQWQAGADQLRVGAFRTRFSRFISLDASGQQVDASGAPVPDSTPDSLPLYRFSAVHASLTGIEIEARKRLAARPWTLDATAKLDATRGTNLSRSEPLPRVAPWRVQLGLDANHGAWGARVELDHAARQGRVPGTDRPTPGYTIVNLSLSQRIELGFGDALWFAKLSNLGDRLAYSASSIQTIRGLAPLPGRALKAGVRIGF